MALYLEACENEMPQKATLKAPCGDGVRLGWACCPPGRGCFPVGFTKPTSQPLVEVVIQPFTKWLSQNSLDPAAAAVR